MRRAAVTVLLVLGACAVPSGDGRRDCNAEWLDASSVAATGTGVQAEALEIACIEGIANRRVQIGFLLPAGPACHILQRVDLLESSDAVSITLIGAVNDDPNAGACPDEPRMVVTEVDLAAPVADRTLLDGSIGK